MARTQNPSRREQGLEGVSAELVWGERPHSLRLYRFLQVTLGPIVRFLFRTQRVNIDAIPARGPVILVSNHASYLDPALVVTSVRRPLFHFARHDLMRKGFGRWFFLTAGGQIPVNRAAGGNEAALQAAVRALGQGGAIAIYPEGSRSPDGALRRGRSGVGRLALLTGAPCYPVAVDRTWLAWPRGRKFPRLFRRTRVIVGAPRVYVRDVQKAGDREAAQAVADELMGDLARLLGQPYDPRTAAPPLSQSPQNL